MAKGNFRFATVMFLKPSLDHIDKKSEIVWKEAHHRAPPRFLIRNSARRYVP
jgi:hypothetical protein